jgi:DNA-binding transcriptional ArsR family regulator
MDNDDVFQVHSDFCRVFSNVKRLKILWLLGDREMSVSEIADSTGITLANASQQLQIMRTQGAVKVRRDGQHAYYRVANSNFLLGSKYIRRGLIEEHKVREELIAGLDLENPAENIIPDRTDDTIE